MRKTEIGGDGNWRQGRKIYINGQNEKMEEKKKKKKLKHKRKKNKKNEWIIVINPAILGNKNRFSDCSNIYEKFSL